MKKVGVFVVLFLMMFTFASAEIIISQPGSEYSLGDTLDLDLTIVSESEIVDFLTITLHCDDATNSSGVVLMKTPLSVLEGENKNFDLTTRLDPTIISDSSGKCYVKADFDVDSTRSQKFEISDQLDVSMTIDGSIFNPGDNITIFGRAEKQGEESFEGYFKIESDEISLSATGMIIGGEFSRTLQIPQNAKQGNHDITLTAYDRNSKGQIMNSGEFSDDVTIRQIAKTIHLGIDSSTYIPGEEFSYKAILRDQSGQEMKKELIVSFLDSSGNIISSKPVMSGDQVRETFDTSSDPGKWMISAEYKDLLQERDVFFEKLERLDYTLLNNTLKLKNIGNVEFNKEIQVFIGDNVETLKVKLNLEEEEEYVLSAPSGEYEIKISEGESVSSVGRSFLTGNAVSIKDASSMINFNSSFFNIIIWILVVLILVSILIGLYRKLRKRPQTLNQNSFYSKPLRKVSSIPSPQDTSKDIISGGERQTASIISLDIKNMGEIHGVKSNEAIDAIDQALIKIKESGAKIYSDGNRRVIILAPILTRKSDNTDDAIGVARSIRNSIEEFNRSNDLKISYGIGVHEGTLIVEKMEGKFRFTSINGAVRNSKALADLAERQIYISNEMHGRTAGKYRSDKVSEKAWRLTDLTSKHRYEQFIQKFEEKQIKRLKDKKESRY